jgi:hypothetical protein
MLLVNPSALVAFVPPEKGAGVSQFIKIAKKAGVKIGKTVASKWLEAMGGVSKMDTFLQMNLAPNYVSEMQRLDPAGTYILHSTQDERDNRFMWLYRASGAAKEIWLKLRGSSSVDGARYKNITGGCLLASTALTANNALVPLAQMLCDVENKANALIFLTQTEVDFPPLAGTPKLQFCDRGKGLIAALEELFLEWRGCTQHFVKVIPFPYVPNLTISSSSYI